MAWHQFFCWNSSFFDLHNIFHFVGMVSRQLEYLKLELFVVDNFGNTDSSKNDLAERQIANLILNAEGGDSLRIFKDDENFELKVSNFNYC